MFNTMYFMTFDCMKIPSSGSSLIIALIVSKYEMYEGGQAAYFI